MRTAVVRVGVDPGDELTPGQLREGTEILRALARDAGSDLIDHDISALPAGRREVQLLIAGDEQEEVERAALRLCADAFGTCPIVGVVTYVSRGTDDDAHGVLSGFGLTAHIERVLGADGLDVVHVRLAREDLDRVPESRVHTALEAALNCEVRILAT
ncbi:hypothetical protein [Rhodococcus sp. NPDC003322]